MVALTTEQVRGYWPADDLHVGEWIDVDLCQPEEYAALAEDAVLALGKDFLVEHENLIAALKPSIHGSWPLKDLAYVRDFALRL